ncbi:hypothetical protein C8R44DRAFT_769975 [Mycena epipterygia]|nr:hypothetical protein C8R44DRAFT_769975 [Mycena epipterygia]
MALDPESHIRYYLSENSPVYPKISIPGDQALSSISQVSSQPVWPPKDCNFLEFKDSRFKLGDFGVGFGATEALQYLGVTIQSACRSPEILIGTPWNSAVDIWSTGCLVYELLSGNLSLRQKPEMHLKMMTLRFFEDPRLP